MKKIIIIFLAAFFAAIPLSAEDDFNVEIIRPAAMQKGPLFDKTVLWITESFRSSKAVIEVKDREQGIIVGNGNALMALGSGFFLTEVPVMFTVRIDMKDNKYRMTFKNVRVMFNDNFPKPIEETNRPSTEPKARERFEQLANSLDAYLAKPNNDF
jgi:hypothetical protein